MRALLSAYLILSTVLVGAHAFAAEPTWQSSVAPVVELGIRDKYGSLKQYIATFTVTLPNGRSYSRSIIVQNDDFGSVTFPDARFKDSSGNGVSYVERGSVCTWAATVNGVIAVNGSFIIRSPDMN